MPRYTDDVADTNVENPVRPSAKESVARSESRRSLGDSRPEANWSRVNAVAEKPAKRV
jgi:hypothetical protein